jgi:ankyrin repeat protein
MSKRGKIFLAVTMFFSFLAIAKEPILTPSTSESVGFLDQELAKDQAAAESKQGKLAKKVKDKYQQSKKTAANAEAKVANEEKRAVRSEKVSQISSDSKLDDNSNKVKATSYDPNSWVPKLVKSDASKKMLEKYRKEQEELVNKLLDLNYNTYAPPKQLYGASNQVLNKHLPPVYNKSDYFEMGFKAIEKGDDNALRAVLSDAKFLNQQNQMGDTLLIFAIQNQQLNSARLLLAKGALPDMVNKRQRTALHYAVSLGNEEAVKLLLSMGAKPDLPDDMDLTPLDYAMFEKQEAIIKMITQYFRSS